ncbi:NAD(P)-dependent oxidoreductase [Streptomyces fuscichromogenes]|uniref:6-phosphogluconate dehydrogenase n=1 Tax=Streptomyces fuscichromogenes TaxID=1324013 RepID=A0A918CPS1_9ACTN|nr:NAD(P)-dependent oxidoreductase [Streptomyces fuscichromogenes]GGM98240.1 6-phosphogluconate dehydrogenase [Streptomyces fuscichromogenes]
MSGPREVRRVGFIGLGSQGGPMARRIAEAGIPTTLWARRPEALAEFRDTDAALAASPAELAAAGDLVCVCVLDDAAVEQVVTGPGGVLWHLAEGSVIAVHSTVRPDTVERLADRAAERGIAVLDAPVSGGGPAAEQGRLLVMLGGDTDAVQRCRHVFVTYGDPVVHLGPVGAGQRAKLVNNLLLAANMGVAESAFALARELGVDPAQLSVVLAHGTGRSFGAGMVREPEFTLRTAGDRAGALLQKDVRLIAEVAKGTASHPGIVLDAADAALASMGRPR